MYKRFLLLICILILSVPLFAQLEVKQGSFKEVPGFVNINPDQNYQNDDNDLPFAVIKVRTENIDDKQRRALRFESNMAVGIMLEYKTGEVWVYLTAKYADYLKISHPDFSSTEFTIPFDLQPKKGYEMTLVNKTVPVSSGWASLTIQTKPENGAKILLNGRDQNATTPYTNNMLPAGKYEITVSKNKFETTTQIIDIQEGDNKIVEIEMPYLYGELYVTSEPSGANVIVDGKNYGVTPAEITNIVVGTHELRLEKQGCASVVKTITVDKNNKLSVNEKLPTEREISISTDGTGDKIFVDGSYIGNSPLTATLSFGEHEVTAIRGYDGGGTKALNAIKGLNGVKAAAKTITVAQSGGDTSVKLAFLEGAINGVFSVSSSKKVHFSQGNLQYQASTKTWRFAEHQWDIIGDGNKNISSSYSGWIDLFGWGTGNKPTMSLTSNSYYSSFNDWGNNTISNGGGKSWFTLTNDEWVYLFNKRSTSSGIRYAKVIVNGVKGVILLPDNWSSSYYKLRKTNKSNASFGSNRISQSDWTSKLEAKGAVFLPAAGYRWETSVHYVGSDGSYWSSTYESINAYYVYFYDGGYKFYCGFRDNGRSVRLVSLAEN